MVSGCCVPVRKKKQPPPCSLIYREATKNQFCVSCGRMRLLQESGRSLKSLARHKVRSDSSGPFTHEIQFNKSMSVRAEQVDSPAGVGSILY